MNGLINASNFDQPMNFVQHIGKRLYEKLQPGFSSLYQRFMEKQFFNIHSGCNWTNKKSEAFCLQYISSNKPFF